MRKKLILLLVLVFLLSFLIVIDKFFKKKIFIISSTEYLLEGEEKSEGLPPEVFSPPLPPEGGFRVLINDDALFTNTPLVILSLFSGPNTVKMAISNFSDFHDAEQEPYISRKEWDLCKGQEEICRKLQIGELTSYEFRVYAKFYTQWGRSSEVVSDSIIYKKEIPIEEKPSERAPEKPAEKPKTCLPYLTKSIRFGAKNDPEEVKKLQAFLRDYEGFKEIKETGIYDKTTFAAVIIFQVRYAKEILLPLKLTEGTGHVYKTTAQKINELYCQKQGLVLKISCPYFVKNLKLGMKDPEVKKVKEFLKEQGLFEGIIDNNFDQTLFEAVKKFQSQYSKEILAPLKINQPTGYWYAATRKKADQLKGCYSKR